MEDNSKDLQDLENNKNDNNAKFELPLSPINNYSYEKLLDLNKEYSKQLSKTIEMLVLNKKKLMLSKKDMQVLNDLFLENYKYLLLLISKPIFGVEFENLYSMSLSILSDLSQIEFPQIKQYQKLQKLKFMELKFQSLRLKDSKNDFLKADLLLDEMESIQKDPLIASKISLISISSLLFYKAITKFYLEDIDSSEKYAFKALDNLERNKSPEQEGNKKIELISNILQFLIEIYDLKKDYSSAISCYEKIYYLNVGKFGVNNANTQKFKKKKEEYENELRNGRNFNNNKNNKINNYNDNLNYNEDNNFINKKLMEGNIANAKGTAETFSFKIPITKNIEPMIISFYALSNDDGNDRFSSELFLKNIYLDKNKLFNYYGMNEHTIQQNYFLYTDDAINDILENIRLEENSIIVIENPMVRDALINC